MDIKVPLSFILALSVMYYGTAGAFTNLGVKIHKTGMDCGQELSKQSRKLNPKSFNDIQACKEMNTWSNILAY